MGAATLKSWIAGVVFACMDSRVSETKVNRRGLFLTSAAAESALVVAQMNVSGCWVAGAKGQPNVIVPVTLEVMVGLGIIVTYSQSLEDLDLGMSLQSVQYCATLREADGGRHDLDQERARLDAIQGFAVPA